MYVESEIDENLLAEAFRKCGKSPFQMPSAIYARKNSLTDSNFAYIDICDADFHLITAFEHVVNNIWKCFILNDGFLSYPTVPTCSKLLAYIKLISNKLNASGLYFPHISKESPYSKILCSLPEILTKERLPSPIIKWNIGEQNFLELIKCRSKQRATRSWNKFERTLQLNVVKGQEAIKALERIESRTWKYACGQSMFHREHQLAFYTHWLLSGDLVLHLATDNNTPVAYRLDCNIGNMLFTLKYSYDEEYKKFSPGYYLLTKGCYTLWNTKNINVINLWGSPDLLKTHIMTNQYVRQDFFWPASNIGMEFLTERQLHDERLELALQENLGLKSVFSTKSEIANG